jgi:hypothetical protein
VLALRIKLLSGEVHPEVSTWLDSVSILEVIAFIHPSIPASLQNSVF